MQEEIMTMKTSKKQKMNRRLHWRDENDVERAGFDCIAIAESEVEIEPATLSVCKVEFDSDFSPEDFIFTVNR
jgi:hypothetical protein